LRHPLDCRQPESTPGKTYLKPSVSITFSSLLLQPLFNKKDNVKLKPWRGDFQQISSFAV